jgi:hypothetical protein
MVRTAIVVAALSALAGQVIRGPAGTVVPGTANPNLAGRAGGYTCCGGDGSPPQDPVLVENLLIEGCDTLHFAATGRVSFDGGTPTGNNPDGDSEYSMPNYGDGIASALSVRTNALVGVFLSDDSPTGQDTPAQLTFAGGRAGVRDDLPGNRSDLFHRRRPLVRFGQRRDERLPPALRRAAAGNAALSRNRGRLRLVQQYRQLHGQHRFGRLRSAAGMRGSGRSSRHFDERLPSRAEGRRRHLAMHDVRVRYGLFGFDRGQ